MNKNVVNKKVKKNLSLPFNMNNQDIDDNEDNESFGEYLGYFEQRQHASKITLILDEQIRMPSYYRGALHRIRNAEEGDYVEVIISSYGGSLDGAISIINALEQTDAQVAAVIDGIAASAASLIALSCSNIQVSSRASMMLHSGSFATMGKQAEVVSHAVFEDARAKKVTIEAYSGFLTEKELQELFMGKDFWMNADEIIKRLKAKAKYLKDKNKEVKSISKWNQFNKWSQPSNTSIESFSKPSTLP